MSNEDILVIEHLYKTFTLSKKQQKLEGGNVRKKIIAHFISPSVAESRLFYHSKGTISTNKYCNVGLLVLKFHFV